MANKIKFKVKNENFPDFISKLEDLTKIGDSIKLKIGSDGMLMYSMLGETTLLAFKNYYVNTSDYFEFEKIEESLDVVILGSKKFVKNLNFLKNSEKLSIDIQYKTSPDDDQILIARSLQISGGKLKINLVTGDQFEMRDITKSSLDQRMNLKNKKWSFSVSKSDFLDIKKLSNINSDRIININVSSGKVILSEAAAWELEVDQIDDSRNSNLMISKNLLSSINDDQEKIEFNVFETFMLIKDDNSNLMMSFETNFEDND